MIISIIGAGNIGGTLAEKWKAAGHTIVIGARKPDDPETIAWAASIQARVLSIADAVRASSAVLIATPGKAVVELANALGEALRDKLVMDATNMAGPLGDATGFKALRTAGADAVKVFNCTGWENLADPRYGNELADMFMAGGSPAAKERVRQLVKDVDFSDVIDLGGDEAVPLLEAFALVWIQLAIRQKMGRGIAMKLISR